MKIFTCMVPIALIIGILPMQAQTWTTPDTVVAGLKEGAYEVSLNRSPEGWFDLVFFNVSASDTNHHMRYQNGQWSTPAPVGGHASGLLSLDYDSHGSRAAVCERKLGSSMAPPGELYLTRDSAAGWGSASLIYRDLSAPSRSPAIRFGADESLNVAWLKGSNNYMAAIPGDVYVGRISGGMLVDSINVSNMNWGGQSLNLVRDSSGVLHLCWEAYSPSLEMTQFHAMKTSGVWDSPREVGLGQLSSLKVDRLGGLHLVSSVATGSEAQYRSFDGMSWSEAVDLSRGVVTFDAIAPARIGFDSRNRPLVFWNRKQLCIRTGSYWSSPRTIPSPESTDGGADFQVVESDSVHFVWQHGTALVHSVAAIDTVHPTFTRLPATTHDTVLACSNIAVIWTVQDNQQIVENLVELSVDDGRTWSVVDTLAGNPDSLSWMMPKIYSDSCYVRITSWDYWHNPVQSVTPRFPIVNRPPTPPVLAAPSDSLHLNTLGIQFQWAASSDVACDTVCYFIHLWSATKDTSIGPLALPSLFFQGAQWFSRDTTYYWTVLASDGRDSSQNAQGAWCFFIPDTLLTSSQEVEVPREFVLWQNYPNPFNPSTTIQYDLPTRAHVFLAVFNTLGQQVALLQDGQQDAGYHEVQFDGKGLSSGVYLYRIHVGSFTETRKLLLIR
jgi:hypothetical protein